MFIGRFSMYICLLRGPCFRSTTKLIMDSSSTAVVSVAGVLQTPVRFHTGRVMSQIFLVIPHPLLSKNFLSTRVQK